MDTLMEVKKLIDADLVRDGKYETNLMRKLAKDYTRKCVDLDIGQATMGQGVVDPGSYSLPTQPAFLEVIAKLRAYLTRFIGDQTKAAGEYVSDDPAMTVKVSDRGSVSVTGLTAGERWVILLSDRSCAVYHSSLRAWNIAPSSYIDYLVTRDEVLFNLEIITQQESYSHYKPLCSWFKKVIRRSDKHNVVVNLMKQYEGFLNMTADFRADPRCSIGSYIDVVDGMIKDSKLLDGAPVTLDDVLQVLYDGPDKQIVLSDYTKNYSSLILLSEAIYDLKPLQLLEASSFHKLCMYAEVSESAGVEKLLGRVHTKRRVDGAAIKKMRCMFNREYTIAYHRRHRKCPGYLCDASLLSRLEPENQGHLYDEDVIKSKVSELALYVKVNSTVTRDFKPLDWWYDMRPYDSEVKNVGADPIEQAKDKRSSKRKGTFSFLDSEKELESIMKQEVLPEFNLTVLPESESNTKRVRMVIPDTESFENDYATMLKNKEGEQKPSGRNFGMFTTHGKQEVSKHMRMVEHVLSYFDGNLMTPPDKTRKKSLHDMAQMLVDDDTFCILADIEGHNQSMQKENTADLSISIGLLFGEEDWVKLSDLFSNLMVYYPMAAENTCYVSTGQLGGIEGWFNPLWTMHTLLICKLLPEMTDVVVKKEAVYSDDIALIARITDAGLDAQAALLDIMCGHFVLFGMILKPIQTAISKKRVTMLRQHYISGERADAAPKRMLSVSSCGSSNLQSDEMESSGIVSACTSALELANQVLPQTVMKWYRFNLLSLRSFKSAIMTRIDPEIMSEKYFSPATVSMYRRMFKYSETDENPWIVESLNELFKNRSKEDIIQHILTNERILSSKPISDSQSENFPLIANQLLYEDPSWLDLFYIRSLMPVSFGGFGMMALEQQGVTGYRDSVSRSLSILRSSFSRLSKGSELANICITNVLGGKGHLHDRHVDKDESNLDLQFVDDDGAVKQYEIHYSQGSLATQDWPNAKNITTPDMMFKTILLNVFKSSCVNKSLIGLLESYDKKALLSDYVVEELKGAFSSKVARFFGEHNAFLIVEKVLRKVQSTSSMVRQSRNFPKLCKMISRSSLYGTRNLFKRPNYIFGKLKTEDNIQVYLFNRRSIMFPGVNFLETIEPEANNLVRPGGDSDWAMQLVRGNNRKYVDQRLIFQAPMYGSEALYKGSVTDPDAMFTHMREGIMMKIISVSKWITFRSDPTLYGERIATSTNISNIADACLKTLGYNRFECYHQYVSLLARSEIEHRTPLLDAKTSAACRFLPAHSTSYRVMFNQQWLVANSLTDGNLHFDYYKLRVIAAQCVVASLNQIPAFNVLYSIADCPLVRNVEFDYCKITTQSNVDHFTLNSARALDAAAPTKIRWLSENLADIEGGHMSAILPNQTGNARLAVLDTDLVDVLILNHMESLRSDNLWDYSPIWGPQAWTPFLVQNSKILAKYGIGTLSEVADRAVKLAYERLRHVRKVVTMNISELETAKTRSEYLASRLQGDDSVPKVRDLLSDYLNIPGNRDLPFQKSVDQFSGLVNRTVNARRELSISLLRETIVNDCSVMSVEHGQQMLYKDQSMYILEDMMDRLPQMIRVNKPSSLFHSLVTNYLTRDEIYTTAMEILDDFSDFVDASGVDLEIREMTISKVSSHSVIPVSDVDLSRFLEYRVTRWNAPCDILDSGSKTEKLVSFREQCVRSCGDPTIYDSPLGSDVYQSALSIFSCLLRTGDMSLQDYVVDLTAGRGEFYLATKRLGISCRSFSRSDNYTRIKIVEGIDVLDAYDILSDRLPDEIDMELIEKSRMCNQSKGSKLFVVVDLSHAGNKPASLCDLVVNTLSTGAAMICRLNQCVLGDEQYIENLKKMSVRVSVMSVGEGKAFCPDVYLLISPIPYHTSRWINPMPVDMVHKRIVNDGLRLQLSSRKMALGQGPKNCSVIEDMGGELSFGEGIGDAVRAVVGAYSRKYTSLLRCNIPRMANIFLNSDLVGKLRRLGNLPPDQGVGLTTDAKEVYQSKSTIFSTADESSCDWHNGKCSARLLPHESYSSRNLTVIRRFHKSPETRRIVNALLRLRLTTDFKDGDDFMREVIDGLDSDGKIYPPPAKRTSAMMDAFSLLIYDVANSNPDSHTVAVKFAQCVKHKTKLDLGRILMYRRMINRYYPQLMKNRMIIFRDDGFKQVLNDYILDKFIRPALSSADRLMGFQLAHEPVVDEMREGHLLSDDMLNSALLASDLLGNFDTFCDNIMSSVSTTITNTKENNDELQNVMNGVGDLGLINDELNQVMESRIIEADAGRSGANDFIYGMERAEGESEEEFTSRVEMFKMYMIAAPSIMDDYMEMDD
jgi:hypothetical protein